MALRPHAKTHKSVAVARRQIAAGAVGLTERCRLSVGVDSIEGISRLASAEVPDGTPRPAIGEVVWIVPNHVCPVVNLVDELIVARGGRIVDRWPVDARGRNS